MMMMMMMMTHSQIMVHPPNSLLVLSGCLSSFRPTTRGFFAFSPETANAPMSPKAQEREMENDQDNTWRLVDNFVEQTAGFLLNMCEESISNFIQHSNGMP